MFAEITNLDELAIEAKGRGCCEEDEPPAAPKGPPEDDEVDKANLVNRSEMDFNWLSGGSIICTSGSRHLGS